MNKSRTEQLADKGLDEGSRAEVLRMVDSRYWSLYRTLDLTQSEVRGAVLTPADASQSTVSRAIRDGDRRALVEDDYIQLGGYFDDPPTGEEYPEAWLNALRDVLAKAKTDRTALDRIARTDLPTPEWAARRFPELVGCSYHVADHYGHGDNQIARDEHLNHIESVNTERWR